MKPAHSSRPGSTPARNSEAIDSFDTAANRISGIEGGIRPAMVADEAVAAAANAPG